MLSLSSTCNGPHLAAPIVQASNHLRLFFSLTVGILYFFTKLLYGFPLCNLSLTNLMNVSLLSPSYVDLLWMALN